MKLSLNAANTCTACQGLRMLAGAQSLATFVAHPKKAPPKGFATQIMKKAHQSNVMPQVWGVSQLKPQDCPNQWPMWANSLWYAMRASFAAPLGGLWAFLATFTQMANSLALGPLVGCPWQLQKLLRSNFLHSMWACAPSDQHNNWACVMGTPLAIHCEN